MRDLSAGYWVPYQQRYLADRSAQKIVNKSRRIGFTEVVCFERACRAAGIAMWPGQTPRMVRPAPQNIVSAGLEQSKDVLRRILRWLEALQIMAKAPLIRKAGATIIELNNGMFCRAYSGNPKSLRSFEGDLFLDEFPALRYQDQMWAAAAPLARANLGNPEGYEIVVVGTPLGDDNRFYEMVKGRFKESFSQHQVDVYQAVRDSFPIKVQRAGEWVDGTIDDLKHEIGDPDIFDQEFGCSFLSASTRYISGAIYDEACYEVSDLPADFHTVGRTIAYGGNDVARRKDRSAFTRVDRYVDINWHNFTDVLDHARIVNEDGSKGMSFEDQEEWAADRIEPCSNTAIDMTGMGEAYAERMVARFPGRVTPIDFGAGRNKEVLATGLKLALQRGKNRPRADDIELKREVLSVRRDVTEFGNVRFMQPRTGGGHGDRASSYMLAEHASGGAAKAFNPRPKVTTPDTAAGPVGRVRPGGWQ